MTGCDLFSAGDFSDAPGRDNIIYRDPAQAIYKRLILEGETLVGAVLFGLFFFKLFRSKPEIRLGTADHEMRQYAAAARAACFIGLVGASVAAASVSLNSLFYVFAGLACSSVFYQRRAPMPIQTAPPAQAAHLTQS